MEPDDGAVKPQRRPKYKGRLGGAKGRANYFAARGGNMMTTAARSITNKPRPGAAVLTRHLGLAVQVSGG
jgi:hypothetical protein